MPFSNITDTMQYRHKVFINDQDFVVLIVFKKREALPMHAQTHVWHINEVNFTSSGTVWLGVQTWYSVVGCTDLVQCGWMY